MVFTPIHLFNHNIVLTSGMGFDDFGERTYAGSTLVSGTALVKTKDEMVVTNAGIATFTNTTMATNPRVLTPAVGDQMLVTSGPTIVSGTTYLVTNVRSYVDVDGFHGVDLLALQETEI